MYHLVLIPIFLIAVIIYIVSQKYDLKLFLFLSRLVIIICIIVFIYLYAKYLGYDFLDLLPFKK